MTNTVYVEGGERITPATLTDTFGLLRETGGMGWIGLYRPEDGELGAVTDEFGLHPLAVEDAAHGHQRAKLERYGDTLFVDTEVVSKKASSSKPDRGVVKVHTKVLNQDGVLVAEFKRLVLVPKKNPGT